MNVGRLLSQAKALVVRCTKKSGKQHEIGLPYLLETYIDAYVLQPASAPKRGPSSLSATLGGPAPQQLSLEAHGAAGRHGA